MKEKYLETIIDSEWVKKESERHLIFNKIAFQLKDYYKDFKIKRDLIRLLGLSRIGYELNKSLFLIRFYVIDENNEIKFISLDEVIGNQDTDIKFDLIKIKITKQIKTPQKHIETSGKVNDCYVNLPIRKRAYNYYVKRHNSYTGIVFRVSDHLWHVPYTRDNRHKQNPPYLDYSVYIACNEMITKKVTPKHNLLERTIVKMLEML